MPSAAAIPPRADSDAPTAPSGTAGRWILPLPRGRSLPLTAGRPRVMGVLNLTPDSFSDGGRWTSAGAAVEHALSMLEAGADLVDLGAESTRPGGGVYGAGASDVPADEELRRLLPVLERLRAETDAPLSVDTRKAEVARRALSAGADLVNDVSALGDPGMAEVVAAAGCPVVLMHSRGEISTMQREIRFRDLLAEVRDELAAAVARAEAAGIAHDRIVIDPGIGFGKTAEQNLALVGSLPYLAELGLPILLGASRKSFLGAVDGAPPGERLPGSLAAAARGADGGAAIVRVHDVAETAAFLAVLASIDQAARAALSGESARAALSGQSTQKAAAP